eukprot:10073796-Alexandrium_andersonii.AAC.1
MAGQETFTVALAGRIAIAIAIASDYNRSAAIAPSWLRLGPCATYNRKDIGDRIASGINRNCSSHGGITIRNHRALG